jgi:hypothetical protein
MFLVEMYDKVLIREFDIYIFCSCSCGHSNVTISHSRIAMSHSHINCHSRGALAI